MAQPKKDIVGEVYGKLTIIEALRDDPKHLKARCRCECGNEKVIAYNSLKTGHTTTCGCLLKAQREDAGKRREEYRKGVEERKQERHRIAVENAEQKQQEKEAKKQAREDIKRLKAEQKEKAKQERIDSWREPLVKPGDVYWMLTAVKRVAEAAWLWRCECGNEKVACDNTVVKGKLKSCGCLKQRQFTDLNQTDLPKGTKSHELVFTGETKSEGTGDNTKRLYLCRCELCGKEDWYEKTKFKLGYSKCACEKLQHARNKFILLLKKYRSKKFPRPYGIEIESGTRFGKLTVIRRDYSPKSEENSIWYECKCDCGNMVSVRKKLLLNGMTRSCGCLHEETFRNKRMYPDWLRPLMVDDEEKRRLDEKTINLYSDEVTIGCTVCGKPFKRTIKYPTDNDFRKPICQTCNYRTSQFEEDVALCVNRLCEGMKDEDGNPIEVMRHVRGIIGKLEYDIYIPQMGIAIECNGDYWHSEKAHTDSKYHHNKWEESVKAGVRLVQIFESDWTLRRAVYEEFIKDLLSEHTRVYARSLSLVKIDTSLSKDFYNENHVQGIAQNMAVGITYALVDSNGMYLCMMTFKVQRFKKSDAPFVDSCYELFRYAVRKGFTVVGGASRLLNAFEKEYNPREIVSYSDCDLFTGSMYSQLGFVQEGYSIPYFWSNGKGSVVKREQAQVKLLREKYPDLFEDALRENASSKESYIMGRIGYFKVNRAGNLRWVKYYASERKEDMLYSKTVSCHIIGIMKDGKATKETQPYISICKDTTTFKVISKLAITDKTPTTVTELSFVNGNDGGLTEKEKHEILECLHEMDNGLSVWDLCRWHWKTYIGKSR